jgi:hypothetical protein
LVNARAAISTKTLIFVGAVWAAMALSALWFAWACGSEYPFFDDFDLIPHLTGYKPVTVSWLWSQHEEHRLFLARLLMLACLKLSGGDFRATCVLNVAMMATLSGGMIVAAYRARRRLQWSDAFFPLLLLSWQGVTGVFSWTWAVQYTTPVALAGTVLILIFRNRRPIGIGGALLATACIVMLPFCGGTGLGLAPALCAWVVYVALRRAAEVGRGSKANGAMLLALAGLAAAPVAFYFVNLHRGTATPCQDPAIIIRSALQFCGIGVGMAARALWPYSVLGVLYFLAFGLACVVVARSGSRAEHFRADGMLLFFGALASFALGMGYARGDASWTAVLEWRYITAAAPILCWAYFALGMLDWRGGGLRRGASQYSRASWSPGTRGSRSSPRRSSARTWTLSIGTFWRACQRRLSRSAIGSSCSRGTILA